jgi:Holliday junction resolvasome RuvABC endonuclease subunit
MKELMPILALDPATQLGWALSPLLSGVWDLSLKRDESMGMKFLRLRAKLNELLDNYRIQLVVYEAARNAAPKMQGSLVHQAQLQAIIVDWATTAGIESKGYSPKEIKKWATGNGNASKEIMLALAKKRWPEIAIVDDNQADALLLWQMATAEFKFLIDAENGKVRPALGVRDSNEQSGIDLSKIAHTKHSLSPSPESGKVPAKIRRAFRKAGRVEAPLEEKEAFLTRLREAGVSYERISSYRLAKVLKGELAPEQLIAKREEV